MKGWILLAAMGLAACASDTGVRTLSDDVFYVTRQGASSFSSQDDVRGAAMNEAREFCDSRHQAFHLAELIEAHPPFILGNFPKAEVRFRCGGPAPT
jgi:hypothetical protein